MFLLGSALDMMLPKVTDTKNLGLMAVLLGLGALGSPKMLLGCPNTQISLILASIFNISAIYSPIGLCFGYGALVDYYYCISRAHGPIVRFRSLGALKIPV